MTATILPISVAAVCKHCHQKRVNRPRGLCWSCYYAPGIKNLHPSTSKYGRRGEGRLNLQRLPCEPTDAAPGSPEKLEILAERARRNESLWHPMDARYPGDHRPVEQLAAAA
jgi:hypothetical protein